MPSPLPPHLQAAFEHLNAMLQKAEGKPVDVVALGWADLEKAVIKVLGGGFDIQNPDHQAVALGLAATLGEKLSRADGAFWYPNREAPEGAMLGFPEAIIMLSAFGAVADALSRSQLSHLDQVMADIRRSLAQAKFAPGGGAPARLTADDYARLFDPGFIQFTALDPARVKTTLDTTPDKLARDVREALGRAGNQLPPEAKAQFEQQVAGSLQRLEAGKALSTQVLKAPRLVELMLHLFAATNVTGSAPEEFWHDAVFPLAFIGTPASFPPLEGEELEAVKQGVDPLAILLDTVPYQTSAKEDGVLGIFGMEDISLSHPELGQAGPPRLLQVKGEPVAKLLAGFERAKAEDMLKRFNEYLGKLAGAPVKGSVAGEQMQEAALGLLSDLKTLVGDGQGKTLAMRRLTEAEATSEGAISLVRKALQGPRIILSGG